MIQYVMAKGKMPNANRKACIDCYYNQAADVNWCVNTYDIDAPPAETPKIENCKYWKGSKSIDDLSFLEKYFDKYGIIDGETEGNPENIKDNLVMLLFFCSISLNIALLLLFLVCLYW